MRALSLLPIMLVVLLAVPADAQNRARNAQRTPAETARVGERPPVQRVVIGPLLDSLRAAHGQPLQAAFASAACATPEAALCGREDAAAAFSDGLRPQPLRESLRSLVDLGLLSRADAQAVRAVAQAETPDQRSRALDQLSRSPNALAVIVGGEFEGALVDDDAVASTETDAGAVVGTIIAGASLGAGIGTTFSPGAGTAAGAVIGALATTVAVAAYVAMNDEGSGERGDDDDEEDDGEPVGQDGDGAVGAEMGAGGEAGGGGGLR